MMGWLKAWKKISYIVLIIFIVGGFFNKKVALGAIICMLGPILVALLGKGRLWCKYVCPRGSFYDNVILTYSRKKVPPKIIKKKILRITLIFFVFLIFALGLKENWNHLIDIDILFYRMVLITTLIGMILAILYHHRTWCMICPMGNLASFIAHLKRKNKKLKG